MNRSLWSPTAAGVAASLLIAFGIGGAHAADTDNDSLSLKIASALRSDRLFMRAGVIGVKVKTKSGDTYDVTGPVATKDEIEELLTSPIVSSYLRAKYGATNAQANSVETVLRGDTGIPLILNQMEKDGIDELGTPPGIRAVSAKEMGTAGLSVGYFFDDDHKWVVETYILAAPLSTSVTATGRGSYRESTDTENSTAGDIVFRPFGLEGQKIINTKILPPTLMFGRYWGDKSAKFRPYTGVLAMYAIFFGTKATDALNNYVGGGNPGDTTVSLKNAFGVGPMVGMKYQFADDWHLSFNLGSVKLKTQGTITTRNSAFSKNTPAIQDYGRDPSRAIFDENGAYLGSISDVIATGELSFDPVAGGSGTAGTRRLISGYGGVTSVVTGAVAYARTGNALNQGTFVRKADSTLTNTIFMLSVGRNF